jgi:Uma2 family endonuclease
MRLVAIPEIAVGILPDRVRPLRRDEYDRMVAVGLFADEKVELLRGVLVAMSPQDPRHAEPVQRLTHVLVKALGEAAAVRIQLPLALSHDSEPEPDVAIAPQGDYSSAHPALAFLVIEVAVASARKDRGLKAALYAEAGVPEYWVVDVPARLVEVHTEPASGAYTRLTPYRPGESIRPVAFPDRAIAVADFLR